MQLASFRVLKVGCAALAAFFMAGAPTPAIAANPSIKIAVIYDVGGRGDKSFDDAAAAGVDLAKKKFGLTSFNLREIVTVGTEFDRENRLEFLVKAGYTTIIAVGASFHNAVAYMAQKYPESQFAIIGDSSLGYLNVSSLNFAHGQASFLAGVLAAKSSKSGKVGYLGDAAEPTNLVDQDNFLAGAKYASAKTIVITKQASAGLNQEVSSLVKQGVDVIYSTFSRNGDVLAQVAALNTPKHSVKLIGVAPDQFFLTSKVAEKYVIGYVVKRFDTAAFELIGGAVNDQTIMEEIDASAAVYGRVYTLTKGLELKVTSGSQATKLAVSQARTALLSKKITSAK